MRPSLAVEESIKELGKRLKAIRVSRELQQSQVAERSGLSVSTIHKIENGDCGVSIGNYAALCHAVDLGTPFTEIVPNSSLAKVLTARKLPKRVRSTTRVMD